MSKTSSAAAIWCVAAIVSSALSAEAFDIAPNRDPAVYKQALTEAAKSGFRAATIFSEQSFRVTDNGRLIEILVAGRGLIKSGDLAERATCFYAEVRSDSNVSVTATVGAGMWEASTCLSVAAVGILSKPADTRSLKLGIVYKAASPNFETVEPVVLSWNIKGSRFEIDMAGSEKASLAGAKTISEVARALGTAR